jgi:hypothetical protein
LSDVFPPARDRVARLRADIESGLMMSTPPQHTRGADLLLVHCAAVPEGRLSARARLELELGEPLTRLLVYALAGRQGRRGSSSP